MPTAAFLSLESGACDDLGYRQQILQVERGVPSRIVLAVTGHRNLSRALAQRLQRLERPSHVVFASHDPDELLHCRRRSWLYLVGPLPFLLALRFEGFR